MSAAVTQRSLADEALEVLRHAGNPFRNYFARNPDDEICARFHVSELFQRQRAQLLGVVDLYRYDSRTHSEVVPVLGNKGSGKTHLLHSIKHGQTGAWQLLVTPGTFQKDTEFLEYLLFQIIDTLLGGGVQNGARPLDFVSDGLTRRLLHPALGALSREEQQELFPATGLVRWAQRIGLGTGQAQERCQWLAGHLAKPLADTQRPMSVRQICAECHLAPERAWDLVRRHVERSATHDTAGLMRRHIHEGFARAALLGDESELAGFLTYGFAELEFNVRPSRQDLVLALLKVLMDVFLGLKMPVVVAFDQLEDLLLARRDDGGQRTAEAFFAGIVQAMHQVDGICFVVFAERGLWNRFIPSLDGYIQDRLSNPIHVPGQGTIKAVRLEAPPTELVRRVVEIRLQAALGELANVPELPAIFPFSDEQLHRIARTEPTLRDMLQQFRHLFDHVVYAEPAHVSQPAQPLTVQEHKVPQSELPPAVKSAVIVETVAPKSSAPKLDLGSLGIDAGQLWDHELSCARQKLEPEGALTGATRELQAGLGSILQLCLEHGVKVGPWRLQHVAPELAFGEHPTYGVISIAHWACKDGQPWKVGIGLYLGRGPGKPKDLEIKLGSLEVAPPIIDHLILLRPEDDLTMTGKSKTLLQEAERRGRHARLEPVSLDAFAVLYAFPRFLAALSETLSEGQPLPNLADFLQERCEKLLEQICMPVCP